MCESHFHPFVLRFNQFIGGLIHVMIHAQLTCVSVSCDSSYKISLDFNGNVLCANDLPYNVTVVNQNTPNCVPSDVYCGWKCTKALECGSYNFRQNGSICELFLTDSVRFDITPGCSHFWVCDLSFNS